MAVAEDQAALATALVSALSADATERQRAEQAFLQHAQQPGACARLLQLTRAHADEPPRLLAATMLKNEIERRWRPGSRGIPEAERPALRAALIQRLTEPEPSER
eukprot:1814570-Prymnesium_polylepis.1